MQGRKSLHEPLRSTEEAGKGPFQALESPTVFTETGEVQIAVRAWGSTSLCRHWKCCAKTASSSKVSPTGLNPNDLL